MANVIETINDLIQLDVDAVHAYDQAIEACEVSDIKTKLEEFRADHERHIADLSSAVTSEGGEPRVSKDVKGFVIEGFTAIMSQGDHSALLSMRGNEELTNRSYRTALDEEMPDHIRSVVERNYEDEQRHLAWIKDALDQKIWERAA